VKTFYTAWSLSGGELYLTAEQLAAVQGPIQEEIHQDKKELHELREIDVPHEGSIRRLLQTEIAVLQAGLTYRTDEVIEQLDQMLDTRRSLNRAAKRHILARLHARWLNCNEVVEIAPFRRFYLQAPFVSVCAK
jgi:hypothetical protein